MDHWHDSADAGRPGVENVEIDDRYMHWNYRFHQQWWSLWGNRVVVRDDLRREMFHLYQKMMRLREDLRVYGDRQHTEELLQIKARQIIDFSAAYDVYDMQTDRYVGTLRRRGWSSIARDKWEILNLNQQAIATIREDSLGLALLRRLAFGSLLPATFHIDSVEGFELATIYTRFHLFVQVMDLRIAMQPGPRLIDPRLLIAATALLALVEGKQEGLLTD